jgi:predicted nicotinamide N-methyase
MIPGHLHNIPVQDRSYTLWLPDPEALENDFRRQQTEGLQPSLPYWGRLWPAARAMAEWLLQHPDKVTGLRVLELAAGLGLPSLVAAEWAASVICSDYVPEAVDAIRHNAELNHRNNIEACLLNWNNLPASLEADVLLLSDVNYEPAAFAALEGLVNRFLNRGSAVLLATPQRLMAKSFVTGLLPFCKEESHVTVSDGSGEAAISLYWMRR